MASLPPGHSEIRGVEYIHNDTHRESVCRVGRAAGEVLNKTAPSHTSTKFVASLSKAVSAPSLGMELHPSCGDVLDPKHNAVKTFPTDNTSVSTRHALKYLP